MNKISIVTVTYNCASIIENTILSCITQDYDNKEYIIIDGNSSDGTLEVIKRYSTAIDYFISEPDSGIYDAMNKGLNIATGDWIFFLNAGDKFYSSNTLSDIFHMLNADADAVVCDYYSITNKGTIYRKIDRPFYAFNHHYLSMGFNHQCIFVKAIWAKKLMFDLSFRCCADYNMIYQMYQQYARFQYVNVPVTVIEGRTGFSLQNVNLQRYEEARVLGKEKQLSFKLYDKYKKCRAYIKKCLKIK